MIRHHLSNLLVTTDVVGCAQLGNQFPGTEGIMGQQVGTNPQSGQIIKREDVQLGPRTKCGGPTTGRKHMHTPDKVCTQTRLQHLQRRLTEPTTASGHNHVKPDSIRRARVADEKSIRLMGDTSSAERSSSYVGR